MSPSNQQPATQTEFQAMANPTRMRILRMCLYEAVTNKEMADRLGLNPSTTLHHVRVLLNAGLIEAETPRSGTRGAIEKPYKSTGKTWRLSLPNPNDLMAVVLASLDAERMEIVEAGPGGMITNTRLGLQLSESEIQELVERLQELAQEYAARPPTEDGTSVGLVTMLHHLAAPNDDTRGAR